MCLVLLLSILQWRAVFGQPYIRGYSFIYHSGWQAILFGTVLQALGRGHRDLLRLSSNRLIRGICIALCSALRVCRIFPNVGRGNGRGMPSCMAIFAAIRCWKELVRTEGHGSRRAVLSCRGIGVLQVRSLCSAGSKPKTAAGCPILHLPLSFHLCVVLAASAGDL